METLHMTPNFGSLFLLVILHKLLIEILAILPIDFSAGRPKHARPAGFLPFLGFTKWQFQFLVFYIAEKFPKTVGNANCTKIF